MIVQEGLNHIRLSQSNSFGDALNGAKVNLDLTLGINDIQLNGTHYKLLLC
jgi:hypothetical protein